MNWRWKIAQAAEIQWWKRYLRKKSPEEYLEQKKAYWHRVLKSIDLKPKADVKVLDAGCGPAGVFLVLDHCRITALDPLLDAYETKLPHFNKSQFPKVKFYTQKLENFHSTDQYDLIFCLNAINHVDNLNKGLERLFDLLAPNGTLILSTDAHNFWGFKYLFRYLPGDILHPHQYDIEEYMAMIKSKNGKIIQKKNLKQQFFFDYYILTIKKVNHG